MRGEEAAAISLRLPATSANLGPGFDTVALALALYLEVDARVADAFQIEATGRDVATCSALHGNLLLDTYALVWSRYVAGAPQPLALAIRNGIPLAMGCGSSAASRLAGIALASHYGGLGWDRMRMLAEAAALEHHPDNAAACCLGGFVAAGYASPDVLSLDRLSPVLVNVDEGASEGSLPHWVQHVQAISIAPPPAWHALLVLPQQPLATTVSRAVLPEHYGRDVIVRNLQGVALLVAAFSQGAGSLLVHATCDQLHQPYRSAVCPLLPRLLPLAGSDGILSVTLSGAGSGVLLLLESEAAVESAAIHVRATAADSKLGPVAIAELLACKLACGPAVLQPVSLVR